MGTYTLTQLQYSEDRKGPWRAYVYSEDGKRYEHRFYFGSDGYSLIKKLPEDFTPDQVNQVLCQFEEGVGIELAKHIIDRAIAAMREVRVTDRGDMLVFHSKGGVALHGEDFWKEIS